MTKPGSAQKQKALTITVTHPDGTTTDTIVWGGDDVSGAAQVALSTTTAKYPNGVTVDTIMWGT